MIRPGTAMHHAERMKNDPEYRQKQLESQRKWNNKNREKRRKYCRNFVRNMNEFRNRHCKKCGKLLDYRTESDYCKEDMPRKNGK
jgi:hypothetical protein